MEMQRRIERSLEIAEKINTTAFNFRTLQTLITLIHHFRNNGITDAQEIADALNIVVNKEHAKRVGRAHEKVKDFEYIHWGLCKECQIQLVYKFSDDVTGILECPKCLWSKLPTRQDAHRPLSDQEKIVYLGGV